MASDIYQWLFRRKIDAFRSGFEDSRSLFTTDQNIYHPAEFGKHREKQVIEWLKFFIPKFLDVRSGFVITSLNEQSTQCDVVCYEKDYAVLTNEKDIFFPVETVAAVGEIKSVLTKSELKKALHKLSEVKKLSWSIPHPKIERPIGIRRKEKLLRDSPSDMMMSFLICQKFDFNFDEICIFEELYDGDLDQRLKHNMILSIEDGLLLYVNGEDQLAWPNLGKKFFSNYWLPLNSVDSYKPFEAFAHFVFMLTSQKTLYYPEWLDYLGLNDKNQ